MSARASVRSVCVVDDDAAVSRSLRALLESAGLAVETFPSAQAFLDRPEPERAACLVLDVRMPGMGGLELQDTLNMREPGVPIVFITGHGDVRMAVRAVQAGAVDFIEKPFRDQDLLDSVQRALVRDAERRQRGDEHAEVEACVRSLTPREREVLELVVEGRPSKQIARDLAISPKTVEFHRGRMMEKMRAASALELVRKVVGARAGRRGAAVSPG